MEYTYLFVTICIIILFYFSILWINKACMFNPTVVKSKDYDKFCQKYKKTVSKVIFNSDNEEKLYGILTNRLREPSFNDKTIIMYCHGNSWWIGELYYSSTVKMLSNLTSVFMFDYRGYGCSQGEITEKGLYSDALGAWNYLTKEKGISGDNIILYGRSLGTSISTKLILTLLENNRELPRALFLDSPFSTLDGAVNELTYVLGHIVIYGFNNLHNLKKIKKQLKEKNIELPICIFHSKDDELVLYSQAEELNEKTRYELIDIDGTHGHPIYKEDSISKIKKYITA